MFFNRIYCLGIIIVHLYPFSSSLDYLHIYIYMGIYIYKKYNYIYIYIWEYSQRGSSRHNKVCRTIAAYCPWFFLSNGRLYGKLFVSNRFLPRSVSYSFFFLLACFFFLFLYGIFFAFHTRLDAFLATVFLL